MTQQQYVEERTKLIPEAEKFAYEVAGAKPASYDDADREAWCALWNKSFHAMMLYLAWQKGLLH
jgi:hypothetical protein